MDVSLQTPIRRYPVLPTPTAPRIVFAAALVISSVSFLYSLVYSWRNSDQYEFVLRSTNSSAPLKPKRRVFLFGIDGVGNLPQEIKLPHIGGVISKGSFSFDVQTVSPTFSAECWTSLLHSVPPEVHKYRTGFGRKRPFPLDTAYPSILKVASESGISTASIVNWRTINYALIENGIPMCQKIDAPTDDDLLRSFKSVIEDGAMGFVFMQFDECDNVGHRYGFFTEEHRRALVEVDKLFGLMLEEIDKLGGENYVMVTSDHGGGGGRPTGHGTDDPQDKTVFWGCSGPGIPMLRLPVMSIMDEAVIAARILGLSVPPAWQGKVPMELEKALAPPLGGALND